MANLDLTPSCSVARHGAQRHDLTPQCDIAATRQRLEHSGLRHARQHPSSTVRVAAAKATTAVAYERKRMQVSMPPDPGARQRGNTLPTQPSPYFYTGTALDDMKCNERVSKAFIFGAAELSHDAGTTCRGDHRPAPYRIWVKRDHAAADAWKPRMRLPFPRWMNALPSPSRSRRRRRARLFTQTLGGSLQPACATYHRAAPELRRC